MYTWTSGMASDPTPCDRSGDPRREAVGAAHAHVRPRERDRRAAELRATRSPWEDRPTTANGGCHAPDAAWACPGHRDAADGRPGVGCAAAVLGGHGAA